MEIFKMFASFGLTDALSTPLQKMTTKIKESGSEVTGLVNKLIPLSQKILPVANATDLLTGAFDTSVNVVEKLQGSMTKVSALFNSAIGGTDNLRNKMSELSGSAGEVALSLGSKLVNSITSSIPATKGLSSVMMAVDKTLKLAKTGFTDIGSVVDMAKTTLNKYGVDLTKVDFIQKGLALTQGGGIDVVKNLTNAFSGISPTAANMISSVKNIGSSLFDLVKTKIPIDGISGEVTAFLSGLGASGEAVGTKLMSTLNTVVSNASGFIGNIINTVTSIDLGSVLKKVTDIDLFKSGETMLTSLANGISSVASLPGKIIGKATEGLSSTIKSPKDLFTTAVNAIKSPKEFLGNAMKGVSSMIASPQEFIKSPLTSIKNLFSSDAETALPPTTVPLLTAQVTPAVATGVEGNVAQLVKPTDAISASENVPSDLNSNKLSAKQNDGSSQNVTISIANLSLPSVENIASFIDELKSLKMSLGV